MFDLSKISDVTLKKIEFGISSAKCQLLGELWLQEDNEFRCEPFTFDEQIRLSKHTTYNNFFSFVKDDFYNPPTICFEYAEFLIKKYNLNKDQFFFGFYVDTSYNNIVGFIVDEFLIFKFEKLIENSAKVTNLHVW